MKWRNITPLASQKYVNAEPLELHLGKKFEGDFSVKIIKNLKKSEIVKLLFNESCITVDHASILFISATFPYIFFNFNYTEKSWWKKNFFISVNPY